MFSFQLQWRTQEGKARRETLRFNSDGKCTKELPVGKYALGWAVIGDPGESFKYTVALDDAEIETNEGEFSDSEPAHGGAIRVEVAS